MLFVIYLAIGLALYFGSPVLPVITVGALMQCAVAYALTRNHVCIRLSIGTVIVASCNFILLPMFAEIAGGAGLLRVLNGFAWVAVILVLIGSTIVGIIGPVAPARSQAN